MSSCPWHVCNEAETGDLHSLTWKCVLVYYIICLTFSPSYMSPYAYSLQSIKYGSILSTYSSKSTHSFITYYLTFSFEWLPNVCFYSWPLSHILVSAFQLPSRHFHLCIHSITSVFTCLKLNNCYFPAFYLSWLPNFWPILLIHQP